MAEKPNPADKDETPSIENAAEDSAKKVETDEAKKENPIDESNKDDSTLSNGVVETKSNDENEKTGQEPIVNGTHNGDVEDSIKTETTAVSPDDSTNPQDGQVSNDPPNEKSASTEQADASDNDDNDTIDDEQSVVSNEDQPEQSDTAGTTRYEITHWPQHLQEAEALWSSDEKKNSPLWKELWDLVLKFLCESPGAFHVWQREHLVGIEDVWDLKEDEILTPLQIAAAYGLTGLCEILVKRGESATAVTRNGSSALWFATNHDIELLRLLLENGADPNHFTETLPPFHRLLYFNPPIEKIKLMFDYKADSNLHGTWGMTSVHWCGGWCQDPEILRLLLDNGADINAGDDMGETGLHKLMWQYDTPKPLLEAFLKAGANVNIEDKDQQQPLYEVCMQGSDEGCRMLLEHGADVEHADHEGTRAMHAAAANGCYDCEKLLIEKKVSLIATDKRGRTPLWLAASNGYAGSSKLIMDAAHEQGCDEIITMVADDGRSPFSKACGR